LIVPSDHAMPPLTPGSMEITPWFPAYRIVYGHSLDHKPVNKGRRHGVNERGRGSPETSRGYRLPHFNSQPKLVKSFDSHGSGIASAIT
jgi:hypothetical protein